MPTSFSCLPGPGRSESTSESPPFCRFVSCHRFRAFCFSFGRESRKKEAALDRRLRTVEDTLSQIQRSLATLTEARPAAEASQGSEEESLLPTVLRIVELQPARIRSSCSGSSQAGRHSRKPTCSHTKLRGRKHFPQNRGRGRLDRSTRRKILTRATSLLLCPGIP